MLPKQRRLSDPRETQQKQKPRKGLEQTRSDLCDACSEISLLDDSYLFQPLGSLRELEQDQICSLCRLCTQVLKASLEDANTEDLYDLSWNLFSHSTKYVQGLVPSYSSYLPRPFAQCFFLDTSGPKRAGQIKVPSSILPMRNLESRDEESPFLCMARAVCQDQADYRLIKDWLWRCEHFHEDCHQQLERPQGLKGLRFVDVHTRRVVNAPAICQYLVLSYVWGQSSFDQADFFKDVFSRTLIDDLPQTIEDALTVTRELGERYIWIDILCINQNDEAEKIHQIGYMADIFGGARATIVAATSEDMLSGIPGSRKNSRRSDQMTGMVDGTRLAVNLPTLDQCLKESKWITRAWTFQESILSTRCIVFTHREVHFQCRQRRYQESITEFDHDLEPLKLFSRDKGVLGNFWRTDRFAESQSDHLKEYGQYIERYMKRDIRDERDRPLAFQGVAKYLCRRTGLSFYLGLPTSNFAKTLLWERSRWGKRVAGYPSWSWMGWSDDGSPYNVTYPIFGGKTGLYLDQGFSAGKQVYVNHDIIEACKREEGEHKWMPNGNNERAASLIVDPASPPLSPFGIFVSYDGSCYVANGCVEGRADQPILCMFLAYEIYQDPWKKQRQHIQMKCLAVRVEGEVAYRIGVVGFTEHIWRAFKPQRRSVRLG